MSDTNQHSEPTEREYLEGLRYEDKFPDTSRDYLERTIETVRIHRTSGNSWPQWANIFADEIERLWGIEEQFESVLSLAEHLFQMIPQEVWREHGAEWMGQYEGDHHAEKVLEQLRAWRGSSPTSEPPPWTTQHDGPMSGLMTFVVVCMVVTVCLYILAFSGAFS